MRWLLFLALAAACAARAQAPGANVVDVPPWFSETLLDLREDVREAAAEGKRLMVYFGQDGCPYCKELMVVNFSQQRIVEKARRGFVAIAINIWGDREVTWTDGASTSEKEFARRPRGAGGRAAARPAVLHAAALRPAARPGRREAARGAVRDALLRGLRRAAPGGLQARGGARAAG